MVCIIIIYQTKHKIQTKICTISSLSFTYFNSIHSLFIQHINALIHADYYGRCGIVIDKEFRKITIANPGSFRISIDAAIAGGISDARNARIFNMFSLIDVGERSGSGLCDLYNSWREAGYKTPVLLETVDPDRITLMLQIEVEGNEGNSEGNDGNNEENPEENDGNTGGNLSKNENAVLSLIRRNPSLSAACIAEELGVSSSTVERATAKLRKLKIIERDGSTRGKWIIL